MRRRRESELRLRIAVVDLSAACFPFPTPRVVREGMGSAMLCRAARRLSLSWIFHFRTKHDVSGLLFLSVAVFCDAWALFGVDSLLGEFENTFAQFEEDLLVARCPP